MTEVKTSIYLRKYGITLKKSLGQVFLSDERIAHKIAANIPEDSQILEIGAGAGTLSVELLKRARKLVVVEIDTRFAPILKERLGESDNVVIEMKDFLTMSLEPYSSFIMCGNLPYHLATKILERVLTETKTPLCIFMFQKEVAERILALPGSKVYGSLTVFVKACARVRKLFDIPPSMFVPNPKVMSTVVRIEPVRKVPEDFTELVRRAFSSRRKKLKNNLKIPQEIFEEARIDPNMRPENITIDEYLRLYEVVMRWKKTFTV